MQRVLLAVSLAMTLLVAPCGAQSSEESTPQASIRPAETIEWSAAPRSLPAGAKMTLLAGDLSQEGLFVLQLKLTDGYHVPLHSHPGIVGITVISGVCHVGDAKSGGTEKPTPLRAGSYASWAPGVPHSLTTEGETVVQLHGEGPWKIDYVDKANDPRQATARRRAAVRAQIEFTNESLAEIKRNVDAGKAVMVDVRSKEEWDQGHLAGSIFLPNDSLRGRSFDPDKLPEVLPEGKVLYTFCQVGMRAKAAAKVLTQYGYEVRVVQPGYEELLEAGFEKGGRVR